MPFYHLWIITALGFIVLARFNPVIVWWRGPGTIWVSLPPTSCSTLSETPKHHLGPRITEEPWDGRCDVGYPYDHHRLFPANQEQNKLPGIVGDDLDEISTKTWARDIEFRIQKLDPTKLLFLL